MLERLDNIPWSELGHAYGAASDVPGLLRDLLSEDPAIRKKALFALYANIWHQGTVYEATAYAVPFLVEIVVNPTNSDRGHVLDLLAGIACGSSYLYVHAVLNDYLDARAEPDFDEQLAQELAWVAAARNAVQIFIPDFIHLLEDDSIAVCLAAANILLVFPEAADYILPAVHSRWNTSSETVVRAAMLRCMGGIAPDQEAIQKLLVAIMDDEEAEGLLRFTATVTLALTAPGLCSPVGIDLLYDVQDGHRPYVRQWMDDYSAISRDEDATEAANYALEALDRDAAEE